MNDSDLVLGLIDWVLWLLASSCVLCTAALIIYGLYRALSGSGRSIRAMRVRDVVEIIMALIVVGVVVLIFASA
jgi:hypothetical protein